MAVKQLPITTDKTRLHSNCFLANILLVAVKQLPITADKTRLHSNCFIANILRVAVKQLPITTDKTRLHSNCFLANILQVVDTLGFNISITPCKRFACVLLMFHFLRRYKLTEYTYVNKRHISCSVLHVECEEMDIPPNCLFGYLYTVDVCMSGGEIINGKKTRSSFSYLPVSRIRSYSAERENKTINSLTCFHNPHHNLAVNLTMILIRSRMIKEGTHTLVKFIGI